MQDRDELREFTNNWIINPEFKAPHEHPVVFDGKIVGTVLYRKDNYQIQLFTVQPNTTIPPHTHPHIDTIDIYISGDIEFWVDDEKVLSQTEHGPTKEGSARKMGRMFRVKPDQSHRAEIGPKGGAFISIQRWISGEPTNVGDDWKALTSELRRNYGREA